MKSLEIYREHLKFIIDYIIRHVSEYKDYTLVGSVTNVKL